VSGNEPVLANIGEARMTSCGGARVIPREVVSYSIEIDPVSTEALMPRVTAT
jgi:hypothetical protein